MLRRGSWIERTLATIVMLGVALFFAGNAALATGANNAQCTQRTAVAKCIIVAALSDTAMSAPALAPADRTLSPGNLLEKQTVAPRSEWIRVAPLVNKRCCGGYTCDQRSGTCVCKQWC